MKKQLLILSSINIFELIEAKHLDYKMIDAIFGKHKNSKASKTLVKLWATISSVYQLLIQNNKIPNRDVLLNALSEANKSITNYIDTVKLPEAREGALVLKSLRLPRAAEIRTIRRVMANVQQASKVSLKRGLESVLTLQEYRLNVLVQNFSLIPPCSDIHYVLPLRSYLLIFRFIFDIQTPIGFY
jgi:hypothetical protein